MARWSSRRQAIEARTAELAKAFQADHGREPTNIESIALAQQATLESREAKHEPRSLAEQRQTWHTEAIEVLGGARALTAMIGHALSSTRRRRRAAVTPEWTATHAAKAITTVSESRATWQRHHVLAEAQRIIRATGHAGASELAEKITAAALDEPVSLPLARINDGERGEPAALRRRDGSSIYTRNGTDLYTSAAIVAAERRILHAATLKTGRVVTAEDVELALADSEARGKKLNPGQVTLVTEMATSGRRVALALAPAGAGKTTAMAALSQAWRNSGGQVVGLAPTAAAAIELGHDLAAPTDTLDKYIHLTDNPHTNAVVPQWFSAIDASTLLIIDEAGKAGTLQLDTVIAYALAKGASVRLVGDDGQIASISAGGVLRDIAAETDALTLSQLVRFVAPEEGAASLTLRAGDPAGIGFYIDRHRVHVGADATAAEMAFEAWLTDARAGRDSLLLAPTNPIVDDLNARARTARLSAAFADNPRYRIGPEAILSDQLAASAGDIIRTRENARWLPLSATDYVRNGYRYEILEVNGDGSLRVRHIGTERTLTLPADYVSEHVTLGYATTIDSAQGLTAGYSCHVVGAEHLTRQLLYVALTRGREENHVYLSTAEHDPHRILSPKATHPDTAVDVLTKILARDGAQISATTAERVAADPFARLAAATEMYQDAVGTAAELYAGTEVMALLDAHANTIYPDLADKPAWSTLRKHLAIIAANGDDPVTRLQRAATKRELDSANDPAAVLDWRLDNTSKHSSGTGPLPWLPGIPRALRDQPGWADYLRARDELVGGLAAQIIGTVHTWTPATAPLWARPLLHADRDLLCEIAVFRASFRVADEDSRLLGADQLPNQPRRIQRTLQRRANEILTARVPAVRRFAELIDSIDPRLRNDSYWPQLADHLAGAAPSRPDLAGLVCQAAAQRPLPDELPAAALWWRLSGQLSHTATLDTPHTHLRPPWVRDLNRIFGTAVAETITTDPAWPALVAAIANADPDTWKPAELLDLAAEHLADADDHGQSITPDRYARLITHTVDMVTHGDPTARTHRDAPTPEHAPLSPEEEEELLPDDPHHHSDIGDTLSPDGFDPAPSDFISKEPPPDHVPEFPSEAEELGNLEFDDLAVRRTPPTPLPAALLDIAALRAELFNELNAYESLIKDAETLTGPNLRAALPRIMQMREAADADLPYFHAVQEVIAQWADADAAYDTARAQVHWAQEQLDLLRAEPDADELDIASAQLGLRLANMIMPTLSPAERFYPALTAANDARAAAAGGVENIVTHAHADKAIATATEADRKAQLALRRRCISLRRDLDRAELAAAAAYAAADTLPIDHVLNQQTALENELVVLTAAGRSSSSGPLRIESSADTPEQAGLSAAAALPFTVSLVSAQRTPELERALTSLRAAATDAGRGIYTCTPGATSSSFEQTPTDSLADLHHRLTTGEWHADMGDILIIDDAAATDPVQLADLATHAADNQARLILLDTTAPTWPQQPSAALLHLLGTDLPWTATAGAPTPADTLTPASPLAPDLQPVVVQAARLDNDLCPQQITDALSTRAKLRETHKRAFDAHLARTWLRAHDLGPARGHDLGQDFT